MVNLPKIITAEDYHEFPATQRTLAKFGIDVNFREIDTDKVTYAAIFFLGNFDEHCQELINQFNK